MYTVYGLCDPRDYRIYYIGVTKHHPFLRLRSHISKEIHGEKGKWIRELLSLGQKPRIVILEHVSTKEDAFASEKFWISFGEKLFWPLTNKTLSSAPFAVANFEVESTDGHNDGNVDAEIEQTYPINAHSMEKSELIRWWIKNIGGSQAECRFWLKNAGLKVSRGYISDVFNGKCGQESVNGQPLGKDPTITVRY